MNDNSLLFSFFIYTCIKTGVQRNAGRFSFTDFIFLSRPKQILLLQSIVPTKHASFQIQIIVSKLYEFVIKRLTSFDLSLDQLGKMRTCETLKWLLCVFSSAITIMTSGKTKRILQSFL